jgi:hypothetical protein
LNKRQKNARQGVPVEQNAVDEEHDDQSSSDTGSEDDTEKGHGSSEQGRGESNVRIPTMSFLTSRSHLHKISRKLKSGRNTIKCFHAKTRTTCHLMYYTKLADHENPLTAINVDGREGPNDDGKRFALKGVNHVLPSTSDLPIRSDLSKRKIKKLKSKKAVAKRNLGATNLYSTIT